MSLSLATQQVFNSVLCEFWSNEQNDIFMSINQLSHSLEYADKSGVEKLISRNEYLKNEEFSIVFAIPTGADGMGGTQETRIFTEDGIYEVTMLSKKPKARKFRSFVRNILKSLRKGELAVVQDTPSYMIEDPVKRAEKWIEERKEFEESKVYSDYAKRILNSAGTVNISQIAEDYGMSAKRMNELLNKIGVQYKLSGQWLLYAEHKGKEFTDSYTMDITHKDGSKSVQMHTKWTQKGRMFIYETLKAKDILPTMEKARLTLIESRAN